MKTKYPNENYEKIKAFFTIKKEVDGCSMHSSRLIVAHKYEKNHFDILPMETFKTVTHVSA